MKKDKKLENKPKEVEPTPKPKAKRFNTKEAMPWAQEKLDQGESPEDSIKTEAEKYTSARQN
jgi:hypothetical protein